MISSFPQVLGEIVRVTWVVRFNTVIGPDGRQQHEEHVYAEEREARAHAAIDPFTAQVFKRVDHTVRQ